ILSYHLSYVSSDSEFMSLQNALKADNVEHDRIEFEIEIIKYPNQNIDFLFEPFSQAVKKGFLLFNISSFPFNYALRDDVKYSTIVKDKLLNLPQAYPITVDDLSVGFLVQRFDKSAYGCMNKYDGGERAWIYIDKDKGAWLIRYSKYQGKSFSLISPG